MSYKLQNNGYVIRLLDGAWIPPEQGNADWRDYQDWLAEGNEPQPADPPPPPPPVINGADFLARVTDDEYAAVISAANANPMLGRWLDILRMRGSIDVSSEATQRAKAYLIAQYVLTQGRADEIFAPP